MRAVIRFYENNLVFMRIVQGSLVVSLNRKMENRHPSFHERQQVGSTIGRASVLFRDDVSSTESILRVSARHKD